jgi:alkyldihydroxyacetonephosphate synthase
MDERELSFWGWGYADKFPDDEERRELKARIEGMLGFPERPLLSPPDIESVSVPEPRLAVPDGLAGFCTTAKRARVGHTYGKSYRDLVRGFHGDFSAAPDVVARPGDEGDVEALLAWAAVERVAVVPFGGGTSVVGGVEGDLGDPGNGAGTEATNGNGAGDVGGVGDDGDGGDGSDGAARRAAYAGVVSLDTRELDRVLKVDSRSRTARIQAGALGPEIRDQLAEHGLQLRHYPQSYEFSTLGGWIATRAGGHFATRYTHIDDFVENVRMITPEGPFETRRLPASGAGPEPNRLVLGSEGTLGVITEAWLRVQPRPGYRSRATLRFASFEEGVAATREVVQARLSPANCRLLDANEAMLNEITFDGSSVLLLGFESFDHPVESELDRAIEIGESHGGELSEGPAHERPDGAEDEGDDTAGDEGRGGDESTDGGRTDDRRVDDGDEAAEGEERDGSETDDWRSSFFEAPYRYNALVSIGVMADTFETAVTWDRFFDLHEAIQESVGRAMQEVCGAGFLSCRFTHVYPDGPAPYYTLLAPVEPGRELEQWRAVKQAASDTLIKHGATITHHHAVGRVHREHYGQEAPAGFQEGFRELKSTYDPAGIMNPGVLIE